MTWSKKSLAFIELKPSKSLKQSYFLLCVLVQTAIFYNALPFVMEGVLSFVFATFSFYYAKRYIWLNHAKSLKSVGFFADYLLLTTLNTKESCILLDTVSFRFFHHFLIEIKIPGKSYFILKWQLVDSDFYALAKKINGLGLGLAS